MVIWIVLIIGFSALIIFQIGFGKDVGRFEDSFKQISFDKFSLAYDSDDRGGERRREIWRQNGKKDKWEGVGEVKKRS